MDADHYRTGNALKRFAAVKAAVEAKGFVVAVVPNPSGKILYIRNKAHPMTYPLSEHDIDSASDWMLEQARGWVTDPIPAPSPSPSVMDMLVDMESHRVAMAEIVTVQLTAIETERLTAKGNPFARIHKHAARIVDAIMKGMQQ